MNRKPKDAKKGTAITEAILPKILLPVNIDEIHRLAHEALVGTRAIMTIDEFALMVNRSASTIYHCANPNDAAAWSLDVMFTLIRESINRGNFDLISLILPRGVRLDFVEDGNQTVDIEIAEAIEHIGLCREEHVKGNKKKALYETHMARVDIGQLELSILEGK